MFLFRGIPGLQGPQGPIGVQGPKGDKGEQVAGFKGPISKWIIPWYIFLKQLIKKWVKYDFIIFSFFYEP